MRIDEHGNQNGVDEWNALGLNEGPRNGRWLFATIVIWLIIMLCGILSLKFFLEDRTWLMYGALALAAVAFIPAYVPRWLGLAGSRADAQKRSSGTSERRVV
jgi:biotin transporter BioY